MRGPDNKPRLENNYDPLRAFLYSVQEARIEYDRLSAKLESLESQCQRITPSLSGTHRGGGDAEGAWAALADERERIGLKLFDALKAERAVSEFIDALDRGKDFSRTRIILRLRYLECLSWRQVQKAMEKHRLFYSDRQILNLHAAAMRKAQKLWDERQKGG